MFYYTKNEQHGHQMAVLFVSQLLLFFFVMLCLIAAQYHLIQLHLPVYRHLQPH